jgi:hypothetical protein
MTNSRDQQWFPPSFFAASDNFDQSGMPHTEYIRVWPEYKGAYPELYTEFMSKEIHEALLAEAVRVARRKAFEEAVAYLHSEHTGVQPGTKVSYYIAAEILRVWAASTEGGKGGGT